MTQAKAASEGPDHDRRRGSTRPERRRLLLSVVILGLVPVIALSWRAANIAQSHRRAAESALRDFAALSAIEYSQRLYRAIRSGPVQAGFQPFSSPGLSFRDRLPTRAQLFRKEAADGNRAYYLVRRYFRYDITNRLLRTGEQDWDSLDPEFPLHDSSSPEPTGDLDAENTFLQGRIEDFLRRAPGELVEDAFLTGLLGDQRRYYCCRFGGREGERVQYVLGFECEPEQFQHVLAECAEGPVVPEPLLTGSGRAIDDSVVSIGVWSKEGQLLFDSAVAPGETIGARRELDASLGDVVVEALVRTDVADQLLTGGIPPSRIPEILSLLVLSLVTVGVTGVLVRRELALVRLRSDFIASVSHELRTPLAQIRLFADTLRLGRVRSEEDASRGLLVIDREARRLELMLDNVLQFSRSERRTVDLRLETVSLATLVAELQGGFGPLAAVRHARLSADVPADLAVRADPEALRRILLNLLDNAVKYGPDRQTVSVGARSQGEWVSLWVDDEGPGVEETARERVFERYWRSSSAVHSGVTGTGIGLAVVKELVTRLGGSVAVGSAPDGGARFELRLRSAPADPERREAR